MVAYIRHLEGAAEANKLTPEQISEEASKLRGVITRGIEKQMKWSAGCKHNAASFAFEGICSRPEVMARVVGVEDAGKFKMKKYVFFCSDLERRDCGG